MEGEDACLWNHWSRTAEAWLSRFLQSLLVNALENKLTNALRTHRWSYKRCLQSDGFFQAFLPLSGIALSLSQDYMSNKRLRGKKWSGFHCRWERTEWVNTSMKGSNIYYRELWAFGFASKTTRSCTLSLIALRSIQRSSDELCGL